MTHKPHSFARLLRSLLCVALAASACAAQAFQVSRFTPQGEVAKLRQVVVQFDQPAVRFGDAKAAAPLTLSCDGFDARGSGRWNSDREWVFDFERDLPPGVRCSAQLGSQLRSLAGAAIGGKLSYQFNSGGPFVAQIWPSHGAIDEEQYFLLRLTGSATPDSVRAHVWCQSESLGERIAVRLIEGAERAALLKTHYQTQLAAREPGAFVALACTRRLSAGSTMQLVYGQGVATPGGVANKLERRFDMTVREPFSADFSCERENAQSACLPLRAMTLNFSAPVPRQQAAAIRLRPLKSGSALAPSFNEDDAGGAVSRVVFAPWFAEQAEFSIELPKDLRDDAGRPLSNADSFPLKVATGPMPPLAKFAAAPFGIVERFAEPGMPPLLPVTLRRVEPALPLQSLSVADLKPDSDAEIIAWWRRLQRYDAFWVPRRLAAAEVSGPLPPATDERDADDVQSRMLSLLKNQSAAKTLSLPLGQGGDPRPFEVVGIPLTPGFHVLELESPLLGNALLDPRFGGRRSMYVRTAALVTNLGVHFKLGRENALAWVTTLDKGLPVAGARVRVSDCRGRQVASGSTDARGIVSLSGIAPAAPVCADAGEYERGAWFVSARAPGAGGVEELAFTWSDWQRGIEPWRFNVPTSSEARPDQRAHTLFDRNLLRAGETVSMKHLLRRQTASGFALPVNPPDTMVVSHLGSNQQYSQPLRWRKTATGGLSAESSFTLPQAARLGAYEVSLIGGKDIDEGSARGLTTGQFRVEEFRLPVLQGQLAPADKKPLVKVDAVPLDVQVNYVAGGPAAALPVRVSALLRSKSIDLPDWQEFSFSPPRAQRAGPANDAGEEEASASEDQRVVANKLPLVLDKNGVGRIAIDKLPASSETRELLFEASYADPSGEVQTLRASATLWPAAVIAGIKADDWVSVSGKSRFQALALDLAGKPLAGVPLEVHALARVTTSSRKRMVGGFYSYDNQTSVKDLGRVCSGKSDARGLLQCETQLREAGQIELVVSARDAEGRLAQSAGSIYATRQGELWFGGENHDRIDLLPEKKSYEPGETARFQVRMPFRFATALVTVEREGLIETQVVSLNGRDPTLSLPIKEAWAPNVYVSVLALRGRLREVPWYSFFTWGFKAPREWWTAFWHEGREHIAPTALVDLSKPAFRLGMAEIRVGAQAHRLAVDVKPERDSYPVRGKAEVTLAVRLPDGKPAARAEVALAAVDQALLELSPNNSWNLLEAMLARRAWGVETSTAQMEIIGRRHYGRKAVPAGGGGGAAATRELLDTLLLWNPRVQLDAKGEARITVPLNDALTSFRIVAIADAGTGLFGTGGASIRTTQDLQIISGLPPLVREEDRYRAQFTLRNTTAKAMKVTATPRASGLKLEAQSVDIPPNEARELAWDVVAPLGLGLTRAEALLWEIEARDSLGGARDALKASQRIVPAVPLTVQQAMLAQLDAPLALEVAPPAGALLANGAPRGGLKLAFQPRLVDGLPGLRDWFERYPYVCLEQKASKALGLRDEKLWQTLVAQLPGYLDRDGLAQYFPPRGGDPARGSDSLSAYLLSASHEAASLRPALALPPELRAQLERGLTGFVEGRVTREFWSPSGLKGRDLDVRKLAAIEALARHGKARPAMLASITQAPNQWPTHALIHWIGILQRVDGIAQRQQRLAEATQILRARLAFNGTRLGFSTESGDAWWWAMASPDTNAARLLSLAIDDAGWKDDLARLVTGLLARQQRGVWSTTTANLWGGLALEKFSARFEATPVSGSSRATLGSASATMAWSRPASNSFTLPWGADKGTLAVTHQGSGKPWFTLQSLAAVPLTAPFAAGYQIRKSIKPVEQARPGQYSRGDIVRISLEVSATADMTWVVVSDPVPGGATILGSGLGRDSEIATRGEQAAAGIVTPAFEERSFEAFRAYYEYLPKGTVTVEYTVRLNNEGDFALPPSRVEAMYAPEVFGEIPNAALKVLGR